MKYAERSLGSWQTEVIEAYPIGALHSLYDPACGNSNLFPTTAIAVGPDDAIHMTYYYMPSNSGDIPPWKLRYATNEGGDFAVSDVAPDLTYHGSHNDIAVDSTGTVHVTFERTCNPGETYYAINDGGGWTRTVLESGGYFESSAMVLDAERAFHISYLSRNGDFAREARYVTGTMADHDWSANLISDEYAELAQQPASYTSIALSSDDKVYVLFIDRGTEPYLGGDLRLATLDGGSWTTEELSTVGHPDYFSSMVLDEHDEFHVVFYDDSSHGLRYLTNAY